MFDLNLALGLKAQQLNIWQMGLRAAIIYLAALLMVRIAGDRRFVGKYATFDVILSIIFGSTLSRAINGTSAFFETIFAGFVLVGMHWLFSAIAFHFTKFESTIKGRTARHNQKWSFVSQSYARLPYNQRGFGFYFTSKMSDRSLRASRKSLFGKKR